MKRKNELHGLKDILVRENEKRTRETTDLKMHLDAGLTQMEETLEREVKQVKDFMAHTEEDLLEAMKRDKKEMKEKIESEVGDCKKKIELETNEMRDRMQSEKKAAATAMEEEVEDRKRDMNQVRLPHPSRRTYIPVSLRSTLLVRTFHHIFQFRSLIYVQLSSDTRLITLV